MWTKWALIHNIVLEMNTINFYTRIHRNDFSYILYAKLFDLSHPSSNKCASTFDAGPPVTVLANRAYPQDSFDWLGREPLE